MEELTLASCTAELSYTRQGTSIREDWEDALGGLAGSYTVYSYHFTAGLLSAQLAVIEDEDGLAAYVLRPLCPLCGQQLSAYWSFDSDELACTSCRTSFSHVSFEHVTHIFPSHLSKVNSYWLAVHEDADQAEQLSLLLEHVYDDGPLESVVRGFELHALLSRLPELAYHDLASEMGQQEPLAPASLADLAAFYARS